MDIKQTKKEEFLRYLASAQPMTVGALKAVMGKPTGEGVLALAIAFTCLCRVASFSKEEAYKFIEATWDVSAMVKTEAEAAAKEED